MANEVANSDRQPVNRLGLALVHSPAAGTYAHFGHVERPARIIASAERLRSYFAEARWFQPVPAADEELLRVHSEQHLKRLQVPADFDSDTPYHENIAFHAREAAGAAVMAVDLALEGYQSFSLMRPPGHHASRDRAMGFCYLNSVAIAAFHALQRGCRRVAIWDFDAHHGNGTQDVVAGNAAIRFASVHQYPGYPGTGTRSEGNLFNWPIPPLTAAELHVSALKDALAVLVEFQPDLLLVSAGFDAYSEDPITSMTLELEHFERFGEWLNQVGDIPVAAVLEGGYSEELGALIEIFLRSWTMSRPVAPTRSSIQARAPI